MGSIFFSPSEEPAKRNTSVYKTLPEAVKEMSTPGALWAKLTEELLQKFWKNLERTSRKAPATYNLYLQRFSHMITPALALFHWRAVWTPQQALLKPPWDIA